MKKQVFYIHGGESFRDHADFMVRLKTKGIWDLPSLEGMGKWTDALRAELGETYEVFMPQMPNKQNARFDEWSIWFERHFPYLHDGVILVGCSLGGMFLLKYLQSATIPVSVKATILMATPVGISGFDSSDCHDFICDLAGIATMPKAGSLHILHSTDDFLVPYEHAIALHKALPEATLHTFTDKNHFLVPELPELVALIKNIG